ncbi:MAG: hypothetical protein IJX97_01250 [Clostridia bacterium]|nr:hypothetical protein [Clostridia bacterium]
MFCTVLPSVFWCLVVLGFEDITAATATIISALIHECGHIFYIAYRKLPSGGIRSVLSGFRIRTASVTSYNDKIITYLAGPAANIAAFFAVTPLIPFDSFFALLGVMNLATAISNLLPIEGYDGYGVLYTISEKNEWLNAMKALETVSTFLIFMLAILSLYLIDRYGGGYWLFAVFFSMMIKRIGKGLDKDFLEI